MEELLNTYVTILLPFAIPWFIFGFAIHFFFADRHDKKNNNPFKNGIRFAVGYIVVVTLVIGFMAIPIGVL